MSTPSEDPRIPVRGIWVPDIRPGDPLPVRCDGPPEKCTREQVHHPKAHAEHPAHATMPDAAPSPAQPQGGELFEDATLPVRGIWVPDIKPGDPLPVRCSGPPEKCTREQVHARSHGAQPGHSPQISHPGHVPQPAPFAHVPQPQPQSQPQPGRIPQGQIAQLGHFPQASLTSKGHDEVHGFPSQFYHEDLSQPKEGDYVSDVLKGQQPPVQHPGGPAFGTRHRVHSTLPHKSIELFVEEDPQFTFVKKALHATGRNFTLREPGPWTCFFALDDAYQPPRLPAAQALEFAERVVTSEFVENQIVKGLVSLKDLERMDKIGLAYVQNVPITKRGDKIAIAHSTIEFTVELSNGIIHAMSDVLEPHHLRRMLGQSR